MTFEKKDNRIKAPKNTKIINPLVEILRKYESVIPLKTPKSETA